jgi:RHH-type rel operon transcriptional repressor/antitoxin RelB
MNSNVLTLRLEDSLKKKLERLAKSTRRSKSFLAAEAIREYVAVNEWQIQEIKKAIQEADEGDFASDHEVQNVMNKWIKNAR